MNRQLMLLYHYQQCHCDTLFSLSTKWIYKQDTELQIQILLASAFLSTRVDGGADWLEMENLGLLAVEAEFDAFCEI